MHNQTHFDMDYKKLYDKALELTRQKYEQARKDNNPIYCIYEEIFPELRESEDERIRKCVAEIVKCFAWRGGFEPVTKEKCLAWLEKQKEQKPVEWSEEDEKNIYFLTRLIELYIKDGRYETGDGTVTKPEIIKMLKSLRPQKKWKPGEEQMVMLRAVINDPNNAGAEGCQLALRELYEQLKKLT